MAKPRHLTYFTDREEELSRLEQLLAAPKPRVHAAILGLRRTGKTVLLEEFAARHEKDRVVALIEADDAANGLEPWLLHVVAALLGGATTPPREVAPEPTAIRAAAAGSNALRVEVENQLALLGRKRQDRYALFTRPLRFAQFVARTLNRDVIVAIDEFPEVLDLKKLPGLTKLEGAIRAIAERESPDVFFVITGSAVRQMKTLLAGPTPLLTRFEEIPLRPFTPADAETLLDRLREVRRVTIEPYARAELLRAAHGHPFYISRLAMRAADLSGQGHLVTSAHFHEAFHLEASSSPGHIYKACQWVFENSLGPKGDAGRDLLLALARADGPVRPSDVNAWLGWDRSKLSRQLDALVDAELIVRHGEEKGEATVLSFTDPIFALWLAQRTGKVGPVERETMAGLRKIVAQLGAAMAKPYEAYALVALAGFDGKGWPAALFGVSGRREIVVPRFAFDEIEQNPSTFDDEAVVHGKPSQVEVEAYAPAAENWLVEVKAERLKATKGDLEELERSAVVFRTKRGWRIDRLWFVAREGFHDTAESYAQQRGIYVTSGTQLSEIRRLQAERTSVRKRAAANTTGT